MMMLPFLLSGNLQRMGKGKAAHCIINPLLVIILTDGSYTHVVTGERQDDHPRLLRGGVLADVSCPFPTWKGLIMINFIQEMGLGKTLSAITLILWHADSIEYSRSRSQLRSTLIVTPKSSERNILFISCRVSVHELTDLGSDTGMEPAIQRVRDSKGVIRLSILSNSETRHIRPGGISVRTYHGSNRHQVAKTWDDVDVVLTTYDTLKSDEASGGPLVKMKWARVILDEGIHSRRKRPFAHSPTPPSSSRINMTLTCSSYLGSAQNPQPRHKSLPRSRRHSCSLPLVHDRHTNTEQHRRPGRSHSLHQSPKPHGSVSVQ